MKSAIAIPLPDPALYFPMMSGKYDVSPGLTRLSEADFGNGDRDRALFQFDCEFTRFRESKLAVRASATAERHSCRAHFDPAVAEAVTRLIVRRLHHEHPEIFSLDDAPGGGFGLHSPLTGRILRFDRHGALQDTEITGRGHRDGLSALCEQFAEDIAVVHRAPDGADHIVALDICAPSHWTPEEKIGKSFDFTHRPVPGMERSRAAAGGLVNAMIHRPPTVRFTWGIECTDQLNLHPATTAPARGFTDGVGGTDSPLFLRVERQTIWGLPDVEAAIFAIRVYIYPMADVVSGHPERRDALVAALLSMSRESRIYKGLAPATFYAVLRWLES